MTDLGRISNILGMKVRRKDETGKIRLSQQKYVNELLERLVSMRNSKEVFTPIESNLKISKDMCPQIEGERHEMVKRLYRELVGGLIYLANVTQPDIAFTASILSCFCSNPGYEHWLIAKRVLKYLKATAHYGITYIKDDESLKAYSDWAGNIDDRKSRSGKVLFLCGAPISWKSIKQASMSLSTMEAEYTALAEISREIIYIKRILEYMGFEKYVRASINVFCDNQSAIELSKNAVCHKRSKHIDISLHFTGQLVEYKEIIIRYLQTDLMPADILIKALPKCKHLCCVEMLGLNRLKT